MSWAVAAYVWRHGAGPVCFGEEVDVAQRHEEAVVGDDGHALVLHSHPVAPLLVVRNACMCMYVCIYVCMHEQTD